MTLFNGKITPAGLLCLGLLILYVLTQYPFVLADADPIISTGSRGAWTDEGLNTFQIRNYVLNGHFDLLDGDNFLKTPLFSFFLFPLFKLFGISMEGARWLTILFCTIVSVLLFLKKRTQYIGISFVLSTLIFFPIHQYGHLSLAEMYSSILIVAAIVSYALSERRDRPAGLVSFYLLLILAVLFKIQFVYVLVLPVMIKLIDLIRERTRENKRLLLFAFGLLVITLLLMFLLWYLPFKEEWKLIAVQQSGGINLKDITFQLIKDNVDRLLLSERYLIFTLLFLLSTAYFIFGLFKKLFSPEKIYLITVSLCWFCLETHKLCMGYLPMRYMISLYVSMGLFISVVLGYEMVRQKMFAIVLFVGSLALVGQNFYYLKVSRSIRTYSVKRMNEFFEASAKKGDVVIGPWAPAFTWNAKVVSYPIWLDFLGGRDIMKHYKPDFIVSEPNEEDSGEAYKKNNIYFDQVGELVHTDHVALWDLVVYKINVNKHLAN